MMNFVTFNQDYSCLAVGTSRGFRIYYTEPFSKCFESNDGDIAIVEMLFSTSLVALILSPRRLLIKNTKRKSVICELTFTSAVLAVKLNRKRLVVVLEEQIYIYDISIMKLLYTIETSPNPNAIFSLSPSSDNCYIAYPLPLKASPSAFTPPKASHAPPGTSYIAPTKGDVLLFDALKLQAVNVVEAHQSPLSNVTFNSEGTLLATASDKGTIIRVFSVPSAEKLYQFRRGTYPSRIYSMSFNLNSTFLCVSSATDTIHIFRIGAPPENTDRPLSPSGPPDSSLYGIDDSPPQTADPDSARKSNGGVFSSMLRRSSQSISKTVAGAVGGYLPSSVAEMWEPTRDFAYLKIPKSSVPNSGPLRSVVAMSASSPEVMVVTSDGTFWVFNFNMSEGGEGFLSRQYSVLESSGTIER